MKNQIQFSDNSHVILLGRHLGVLPPHTIEGQKDPGVAIVTGNTIWMFDQELDNFLMDAAEPMPFADFKTKANELLLDEKVVDSLLTDTKLFLPFEWDFMGNDSISAFEEIMFCPTVEMMVINEETGIVTAAAFEYEIGLKKIPTIVTFDEIEEEDISMLSERGVDLPLDLAGLFDPHQIVNVKSFVEEISEDSSWEVAEFLQVFLDHIGDIVRSGCGNMVHADLTH